MVFIIRAIETSPGQRHVFTIFLDQTLVVRAHGSLYVTTHGSHHLQLIDFAVP